MYDLDTRPRYGILKTMPCYKRALQDWDTWHQVTNQHKHLITMRTSNQTRFKLVRVNVHLSLLMRGG
jgi:hypothetical protein